MILIVKIMANWKEKPQAAQANYKSNSTLRLNL